METIIDALKAMGKASSIEIAARLDMDRQEVIKQLWDLKEAEVVQQDGQSWKLADEFTPERDAKTEIKPVGMKAYDLIRIIAEKGPITLEELAVAAGVTTRRVASTLAMPTSRGKVVRKKLGEKFHYMLPGSETAPEQTAPSKVAAPATIIETVNISAPKPEIVAQAMASKAVPAATTEIPGTETLTLPTIAHLRQRIRQQKHGARRDEQLLKHLVRVHRLMDKPEVSHD